MFKAKRSRGKSRVKPLLNLALQDSEWGVNYGTTLSVDHDDKYISLPNSRGDHMRKAAKLIAYVDAKYNKPRKYVNVKHLQPLYIKTAENLTTYWYANKKGMDKVGIGYRNFNELLRNFPLPPDQTVENMLSDVIHSIYTNSLEPIRVLFFASKTPALASGKWFMLSETSRRTLEKIKGYEVSEQDSQQLWNIVHRMSQLMATSYKMIMSTRKDSSAVSNKKIKEVAQYLYDECEKLASEFTSQSMPSIALAQMGDISLDTQGVVDDKELDEMAQTVKSEIMSSTDSEDSFWGKMKVVEHKLTKSLPNELLGKSKRKKDIGVKPNAMHRYATDKKIFTDKAKRISGTVLIDASGSMHFSDEDIQELVEMLPASTVAIYSGVNYPADYDKDDVLGFLHVIAKNGKWVDEIPNHPQNNIVDGPALEWLSKQAEPRILVSDLRFTGVVEHKGRYGTDLQVARAKHLYLDAMNIIKKAKVIPLIDVDKAKEWVKAYKKN